MALKMPLMKFSVASLNPLLKFCVFSSYFDALNYLRRCRINVKSTICAIMLKKKLRQVGSFFMKFIYSLILRPLRGFGIKADPIIRNCMKLCWRCKKSPCNSSACFILFMLPAQDLYVMVFMDYLAAIYS